MALRDRRLLRPGDTVWKTGRVHRLAFLVDADAYYRAFRGAVAQARRQVILLGWDVDSRLDLLRSGPGDGSPRPLADFLAARLAARPALRVSLLMWAPSVIFALEREPLPKVRFEWSGGDRLDFCSDDVHPPGASHHQKVAVVDDRVAFVGGIDLTAHRWDVPAHRPEDPRRVLPDGTAYGPYHDLQALFDGPLAAEVGRLARDRWRRARGESLPVPEAAGDPWPEVAPDLTDLEVGLVRTDPAEQARETLHLVLEGIAAARRLLYLENQYLSSPAVAEAVARRLEEPHGPWVVVVGPRKAEGLLEQASVGVLRARRLQTLRAADRHGRLRAWWPQAGEGVPVYVHSKVMVVDDRLLYLGSANLSDRSLGLDTELGVAVEAGDREDAAAAIAALRDRLLAEHLRCPPEAVAAALAAEDPAAALDGLRHPPATLMPLDDHLPTWLDKLIPEGDLLDPDRPLDLDALRAQIEAAARDWQAELDEP